MTEIKGVWLYTGGNHHIRCLEFFGRTLARTLQDLGYGGVFSSSVSAPFGDSTWVVLGAHQNPGVFLKDAHRFIIYNTENPASGWMTPEYTMLLAHAKATWHYFEPVLPLGNVVSVKPALHPAFLRRPMKSIQDCAIDVLFAGSMNQRRRGVLDEMTNLGLVVVHVFGVYGADLQRLVDQSKICLNMHYYESKVFEAIRVQELVSNNAVVLSERTKAGEDWPIVQDDVHMLAKRAFHMLQPYKTTVTLGTPSALDMHNALDPLHCFTRTMHADVVKALRLLEG